MTHPRWLQLSLEGIGDARVNNTTVIQNSPYLAGLPQIPFITQNPRPQQIHKSIIQFTQPHSSGWLAATGLCGPVRLRKKQNKTKKNTWPTSCHGCLLSGLMCAQCWFGHGSFQITLYDNGLCQMARAWRWTLMQMQTCKGRQPWTVEHDEHSDVFGSVGLSEISHLHVWVTDQPQIKSSFVLKMGWIIPDTMMSAQAVSKNTSGLNV